MIIDWTQVLVAAVAGLMSGAAITAVWRGLDARSNARRDDDKAHIKAADAISETSAEMLKTTIDQYESRLAKDDKRLDDVERKCRAYETAFEAMRGDLIQARQTISLHELTITQLSRENGDLRKRVRHLEEENTELRRRLDEVQQK